jgi:adenine-specific DNA methylase
MSSAVSDVIGKLIEVHKTEYDRKYSRLARLHKYWARKPWFVVQDYISKYSKEQDVVLDPFCGSGLMGLEAVLQNRNFIGYDLNPIAAFLAENTLSINFNVGDFDREFRSLETELKQRIMSLYALGDGYLLYGILGKKNGKSYNAIISDFNFQNRKKLTLEKGVLSPDIDLPQGLSYPDKPFPTKFYKDRFSYKGVRNVSDMFSRRNLIALAILFDKIMHSGYKNKNLFVLAFTNTLLHTSKLKAENVRPLSVNNFWIPDDYIEENVWWRFADRVKNVRLAKEALGQRVRDNGNRRLGTHRVINTSSLHMREIGDGTIDYVITDPPYGDAIQYSELSYIWNCWLGEDFKIEDEVVINPVQGKGINEYISQMSQSIKEITRVLKRGNYFTLCFHNKDSKIWIKLIEALREAKLQVVDISSYDTFGYPYNKGWANFSPKSDLYVTFRNQGILSTKPNAKTLEPEKLAKDICNHLKSWNGGDFNISKAYDLFIAVAIAEIMEGNRIRDYEKLNIRSIVQIFERVLERGNI